MNELLFLEIFNRSLTSCWLILTVFVLRFLLKKAPGYCRIILWISLMEEGMAGQESSATFETDKEKKAYISFTPYLYEIRGRVVLGSGEEIPFILHSLKPINSDSDEPDGLWELKYTD